jgi:GST-like protein
VIDLYTWTTPNGRKISIMLEETGLPYRVIPVDITSGEQHAAEFVKISPGSKIPAIVDHDANIMLMESGAILIYLAEMTGKFLSTKFAERAKTIEWLMYQMGNVGPMLGQAHHFVKFNPDVSEYATERYRNEAIRLYGVLDRKLLESPYLAGDEYSIADIATWPWISRFEWQQVDLAGFSHLCRWYREIAQRPAVQRGYDVPHKVTDIPLP